jgi:hypothetical protein
MDHVAPFVLELTNYVHEPRMVSICARKKHEPSETDGHAKNSNVSGPYSYGFKNCATYVYPGTTKIGFIHFP